MSTNSRAWCRSTDHWVMSPTGGSAAQHPAKATECSTQPRRFCSKGLHASYALTIAKASARTHGENAGLPDLACIRYVITFARHFRNRIAICMSALQHVIRSAHHFRDSIVVSISACHAEDPGSIPGHGNFVSSCMLSCCKSGIQEC